MANTKKTQGTNITALIGTMADRGRKFTDGRNALIAHALFTGVKASLIVEESKVDKGDVSRIAKRLSELKACKPTTREGKAYKAILALDISTLDVDRFDSLSVAIEAGAFFRRVKNLTGASGGSAKGKGQGAVNKSSAGEGEGEGEGEGAVGKSSAVNKSSAGEGESEDMQATVHDFLVNAPDYSAARALILSALDSAERAVAERTAEADSEAEAI